MAGQSTKEMEEDYEILPKTHSSMYLMHKYWARKPANVVSAYIKRYTSPNDIVLDPFMGSGVSILESVFLGRRAIGVDLNPMSLFITRNSGIMVNMGHLGKAYNYIINKVESGGDLYHNLYQVGCPQCNGSAIITHLIWLNSNKKQKSSSKDGKEGVPELEEIRLRCQKCKELIYTEKSDSQQFQKLTEVIASTEKKAFSLLKELGIEIPQYNFHYSERGKNFMQLRHQLRKDPTLQNLFSHRNLAFLTYLRDLINHLPPEFIGMKDLLLFALTSSLGQASKMVWVINKRNGKELKKKQVGSWTHHFFWDPTQYFEVNAWSCFKNRVKKLISGKKDSNSRNNNSPYTFRESSSFQYLTPDNPVLLFNQSSQQIPIPDNSIDFVFTDPPYGDSIQYGELSSLWAAWLGVDMVAYNKRMVDEEIIINTNQGKKTSQYKEGLGKVFVELFRVLKPAKFLLVTFHNTSYKTKNALIQAVLEGGFELKQILFQLPPRVSIKSMLHHSGSPIGDYYIRFQKPPSGKRIIDAGKKYFSVKMSHQQILNKLRKIIIDILQKRGEPTSFLWISNVLDEFLCREHLFPLPEFESYIEQLQSSDPFFLDDQERWWFSDNDIAAKSAIPLTKRIEQYLETLLMEDPKIFQKSKKPIKQQLFNRIYAEFRGVNTPDKFGVNKIIEKIIQNKDN